MLKTLRQTAYQLYRIGRGTIRHIKIQRASESHLNSIAAELIRNTHSIEKGLSIRNPRLGFGHTKQKDMMKRICTLEKQESSYYKEVCRMAAAALREYVNYHRSCGYHDEMIDEIEAFLGTRENLFLSDGEKYGGTETLDRSEINFDLDYIEEFFCTRHSIRDFADEKIDDQQLMKALKLAQRAPSACNRQAVRVYVLGEETKNLILGQLEGVGGFQEEAGKYVMITAQISSYRSSEINQYIVSASMYAAYLTLTLHAYGFGACVIQRDVTWNRHWDSLRKKLGISKDEQIVCLVAVGNLKDTCRIPVSHRLDSDEIIKWYD